MPDIYHIVLNSSMGPRDGELCLIVTGDSVSGSLSLLGHVNPVHGIRAGEGVYTLDCLMYTGIEPIPCRFSMEINGGRLSGWADTNRGRMTCSGCLKELDNMTEGQCKYE